MSMSSNLSLSFESVLYFFNLWDFPKAHKYGLLIGFFTYVTTLVIVLVLLIRGGVFQRMREQSANNESNDTQQWLIPTLIEARMDRQLLQERLLEARDRMKDPYAVEARREGFTSLMMMLQNIVPMDLDLSGGLRLEDMAMLKTKLEKETNPQSKVLESYINDYLTAYARCHDKPGGYTLSGSPDARYEAYARAYSGCGIYTSISYKRSYARLYEAVTCKNIALEAQYKTHWKKHPGDIVGRHIRLEALQVDRHLNTLFVITSGQAYQEYPAYHPNLVWGFRDNGPFDTAESLRASNVFQRKVNEAGYAILDCLTDRILGCILLIKDDSYNLKLSMDVPILKPTSIGTNHQLEACFLLMDRLFALGYRRIQLSIDCMDFQHKTMAIRMGFTQEGFFLKDRVSKDANRNSIIYSMLNNDWDQGARASVYKILHGKKAMMADKLYNAKEEELDMQVEHLKKEKEKKANKLPNSHIPGVLPATK